MSYTVKFKSGSVIHSGIKGQKWGVRRYQNEDGTLTPEGKKRYSSSSQNNVGSNVKYGIAAAVGAIGDAASNLAGGLSNVVDSKSKKPGDVKSEVAKELSNTSKGFQSGTSSISNKLIESTNKKDIQKLKKLQDLSKMSDDELRKKVGRMNLEKQYLSLTTPETTKGAEIAKDIIAYTGGISAIAVAVLQGAYWISKAKNSKG